MKNIHLPCRPDIPIKRHLRSDLGCKNTPVEAQCQTRMESHMQRDCQKLDSSGFLFDSEPVNNLSDSCNYRKLPSSYAAFTPKSFDLFLPGLL